MYRIRANPKEPLRFFTASPCLRGYFFDFLYKFSGILADFGGFAVNALFQIWDCRTAKRGIEDEMINLRHEI